MIEQDVIDQTAQVLKTYLTDYGFVQRALRINDAELACGIFIAQQEGVQGSQETGNRGEPTVQVYTFTIQLQVKHADAERGNAQILKDSKVLRTVLYRSQALEVAFGDLSETISGSLERYQRRGITRQRFLNMPLNNGTVFLSSTDFWVETETVRV